jgi:hypothetical protein
MARSADDAKVAFDKIRVKLSGDGGGRGAEAATATLPLPTVYLRLDPA